MEEDWAELEEKVKRFCQFGTLEILGSVSLSPPPTNSYVETLLAVWWYYKVVFLEVILIRRGPEVEPSWGELVSVQGSQGVLASSLCSLPCEDKQYNLAEGCRQNPTMMPPSSWTSTCQTVRNTFLLFISHFIYGMFVSAVQAKTRSIVNTILTLISNLK